MLARIVLMSAPEMAHRITHASLISLVALGPTVAACGGGASKGTLGVDVSYDDRSAQVQAVLTRALAQDESLHLRVRQGFVGELDCSRDAAAIARIDDAPVRGLERPTYAGPSVEPSAFEPVYDQSWVTGEPTPEMLARIADGEAIIDVCVMRDGEVVAQAELALARALDRAGADGKFDGGMEERIASTEAYADLCVAELGDIPFFPKLGDGDYGTFDCRTATPLPTTVTDMAGNVTHPDKEVSQCDEPQYIYDLCEPNAVDGETNGPRVTSADNDEGTHWVLLCRKAQEEEGKYNDIAMIGHNPYTGKTCFFQNALYSRTDGTAVPHPADRSASDDSPATSPTLWSGIHGGLGSGIQCADCHDADPFIHSPWIDGAKRADGTPVVPKMGEHEDFVLGFNDAPYSIVNTQGQGWHMHEQLVSEEASACTSCHRFGAGRWMDSWIDRLDGSSPAWTATVTESHRDFAGTFWMPPDNEGLSEATWAESEYARAIAFIKECARNHDACAWAPVPTAETAIDEGLPVVELEGEALARSALATLGADIHDVSCPEGECATRRCAECHAVSRTSLGTWHNLTDHALDICGLGRDPAEMTPAQAKASIDCLRVDPKDDSSVFATERLGITATGVQYGGFRTLFQVAYGDAWTQPYAQFKRRVSMPKGNHPKLGLDEYAVLRKWFEQDLVGLDEVLDEAPPPASCTDHLDTAGLAQHLETMRFEGWGAANQDAGVRMFGCPTEGDMRGCFTDGSFADRTASWGGEVGTVRELVTFDFATSFWTRSSADGRFVGNGGGPEGATITDLASGKNIAVDALYDPGFFPDNSGFVFQGAPGGTGMCAQSVLDAGDTLIGFDEPQCRTAGGINLYQHVARGLDGGDYFVINSQFTSDPGTGTTDPAANFNASSTMKITPMVFTGTQYEPHAAVVVGSPYEGDSVLSPSSQLVASRLAGPGGASLGYVLRRVNAVPSGDSYVIDTNHELATICTPGAKPNFSFDERFMVLHHYEDGVANLFLVDLADGARYRITDMKDGARALFPHFVSSGWIYFLVRGPNGERMLAASDAALQVAG
ncbi:MAG: hypothetical protein IPK74_26040 [Deltaproteobacteria bacterium]|nr:hypothetical protein [Deltaproteobacteria bacterium]